MTGYPASPALVLVDVSPSGVLRSSAAELIGAATAWHADGIAIAAPGSAERLGAELAGPRRRPRDDRRIRRAARGMVLPAVDALSAASAALSPEAVLIANSIQGRDAAARFAVRTGAALAADAVGVSRDEEGVVAHHSVYGGAYSVESAASCRTPGHHAAPGLLESAGRTAGSVRGGPRVPASGTSDAAVLHCQETAVVSPVLSCAVRPWWSPAAVASDPARTSPLWRALPTSSAVPSAPPVPPSTPDTCRSRCRLARPV